METIMCFVFSTLFSTLGISGIINEIVRKKW